MSVRNPAKPWRRQLALLLVLAVPTLVLGALYFTLLNSQVTHTRDALAGLGYTKALGAMLAEIGTHRSRTREASVAPTPTNRQALEESRRKLDQIVAEVDAADAQNGARFNVSEQWQAIRSQWIDLRTNLARLELAEASNRHDSLLDAIMKHVERVALRTGLSRESDPSAFVALRLAVDDVPRALLAFGEVRRFVNVGTIQGRLSPDERMQIAIYERQFEHYLDRAREGVQDTTDETWKLLQPEIEKAEGAFATYDALIKSKVLNSEKLDLQTVDAYKASREPTAVLAELSVSAYTASEEILQKQLASAMTRQYEALGAIATALIGALAFLLFIARTPPRPLDQAIRVPTIANA